MFCKNGIHFPTAIYFHLLFNKRYIAHYFKMNLNAPIGKTFKTLKM